MSSISSVPSSAYPVPPNAVPGAGNPTPAPATPSTPAVSDPDHDGDHDTPGTVDVNG
jgi:hypothetical protein